MRHRVVVVALAVCAGGSLACSVNPETDFHMFGDDDPMSTSAGDSGGSDDGADVTGGADTAAPGTTEGADTDSTDGDETGSACGNGTIDGSEQCDGKALDGADCRSLGFAAGELACGDDCDFDVSGCRGEGPACGDGQVEGTEQCDGAELGGQSCEGLGFPSGTLACNADCTFDSSMCGGGAAVCGDGNADAGEACDGADLSGQSCASQGFSGGVLSCDAGCSFDTSGCTGGGDRCTFDSDCPGVQYCEESSCYDGVVGDPCTFDSDCMSDICLAFDNFCSDGNAGDPCTFGSECQSGSCTSDSCD